MKDYLSKQFLLVLLRQASGIIDVHPSSVVAFLRLDLGRSAYSSLQKEVYQ